MYSSKNNSINNRLLGLEGKVAVITGGSNGIGREIALLMSTLDVTVAIIDRDMENGNNVVQRVKEAGKSAIFCYGNVADKNEMQRCFETVVRKTGTLDIFINNAGVTSKSSFNELTLDIWERTIAVNLTGCFICSKIAAQYMQEKDGGSMVMISSGSAITGGGGGAHYTASKAGVNGLVRYLSRELAPQGIRVNGVAPRSIDSEILQKLYSREEQSILIDKIPIGRLGTGNDVAKVVIFLASDLASYITGEIILVDGGRTFSN